MTPKKGPARSRGKRRSPQKPPTKPFAQREATKDPRMNTQYKLVMYQAGQEPRAGLVIDEAVFDAATLTGNASYATVVGILSEWDAAQPALESAARKTNGGLPLEKTKLLAPVLYPSAIYCAGANYVDHMQEMARAHKVQEAADPRGEMQHPWHFLKAPRSIVGTQAAVALTGSAKRVSTGLARWAPGSCRPSRFRIRRSSA